MKAVLGLLAIALLLAGCAKPSEGSVPEQDEQGRYVIHMTANNRFTPAEAKVPVGATVIWVNDAGVHDVTAHDDSFRSPRTMTAGRTYQHTFAAEGDYEYHCDLHSSAGMTGTIHVSGDGPTGGAATGTATGSVSGTATTASTQTTATTQTTASTMTTAAS